MYINLPSKHPLRDKTLISFKDLENQNILLFNNLGYWDNIVREDIHNPHFILIDNFETMRSLIEQDSYLYFSTNLAYDEEIDAISVPISDDEAKQGIYAICLTSMEEEYRSLIKKIKNRLSE